MFIATNRIKVKTSYGDTLEQMFKARGAVQDHSGFISFELWKMHKTPDHEEFLVVTHWETEEDHHTWTRSDAFPLRSRRRAARFSVWGPASSTPTRWCTGWKPQGRRRQRTDGHRAIFTEESCHDLRNGNRHRPGQCAGHQSA